MLILSLPPNKEEGEEHLFV